MNGFLRFKGFKFIFSTFVKRKNTSFICGEHRVWKFRKINSSLYVQAVFWRFSPFLKEILKGAKKSLKNAINQTILIFLSKFLCSMFSADKRHVFSFHENRKNQLKAFKTQKPIHFFSFWGLLHSVNDCSVKKIPRVKIGHRYHSFALHTVWSCFGAWKTTYLSLTLRIL